MGGFGEGEEEWEVLHFDFISHILQLVPFLIVNMFANIGHTGHNDQHQNHSQYNDGGFGLFWWTFVTGEQFVHIGDHIGTFDIIGGELFPAHLVGEPFE